MEIALARARPNPLHYEKFCPNNYHAAPPTAARRMNKKDLSERDICTKFITPAVVKAVGTFSGRFVKKFFFTNSIVRFLSVNCARKGFVRD